MNVETTQATAPEELREPLAEIRSSANAAAALTRKLLAYAGRQASRRAPHELVSVVEHAVDRLRASLPAGVRLEATAVVSCATEGQDGNDRRVCA